MLRRRLKLFHVPVELGSRPVPKGLVDPVVPADRDELKIVAQLTAGPYSGECGQEVPCGEVTSRPEYGQPPNQFSVPALARASVTPLAITPIWLNACGKLPVSSPVDGLICSDSRPEWTCPCTERGVEVLRFVEAPLTDQIVYEPEAAQ